MAETISEICEDTKLKRDFVIEKLDEMIAGETVRRVRREVPGSRKGEYLFKSNRVNTPEFSPLRPAPTNEIDYLL